MPANFSRSVCFVLTLWYGLGGASASRAQEAPAPLPSFTVTLKNGLFIPDRLEVPAGRRIKLVLYNAGTGAAEFESSRMNIEKVLAAGAHSFVVLHKLAPGKYEFIDEFRPSGGMLTVIAK